MLSYWNLSLWYRPPVPDLQIWESGVWKICANIWSSHPSLYVITLEQGWCCLMSNRSAVVDSFQLNVCNCNLRRSKDNRRYRERFQSVCVHSLYIWSQWSSAQPVVCTQNESVLVAIRMVYFCVSAEWGADLITQSLYCFLWVWLDWFVRLVSCVSRHCSWADWPICGTGQSVSFHFHNGEGPTIARVFVGSVAAGVVLSHLRARTGSHQHWQTYDFPTVTQTDLYDGDLACLMVSFLHNVMYFLILFL